MKFLAVTQWLTVSMLVLATAVFAADESTGEEDETTSYLFIQHAENMTYDGSKIMLEGVGGGINWFSDRPNRIVGQATLEEYLQAWAEGADSFALDPPNAVLTVDGMSPVVIELYSPTLGKENSITYDVKVLEGTLPTNASRPVLVIDSCESTGRKSNWINCAFVCGC
ncbi:MAG: hypothetical protein AAF699_20975 [Pseudomonadota bacterium]